MATSPAARRGARGVRGQTHPAQLSTRSSSPSAKAEIACTLHMSVATVKAHVSKLLFKLDVDNCVQIALLVQSAGKDIN